MKKSVKNIEKKIFIATFFGIKNVDYFLIQKHKFLFVFENI